MLVDGRWSAERQAKDEKGVVVPTSDRSYEPVALGFSVGGTPDDGNRHIATGDTEPPEPEEY